MRHHQQLRHRRRLLLPLLLALAAAAANGARAECSGRACTGGGGGTGVPAQLSSSVLLFYDCEFEPHYGQPVSQCELLLTRAKEGGARSVNIVPTHYWVGTPGPNAAEASTTIGECRPDAWVERQGVDHYCSRFEWDKPCEPFSQATVARFAKGFKDCLQKAHDMFDEVLVSPHLDDGTKTMHWRNTLMFDPLQKDRCAGIAAEDRRGGTTACLLVCMRVWACGAAWMVKARGKRRRQNSGPQALTMAPSSTTPLMITDPLFSTHSYGNSYWDVMLAPILDAAKAVYTKPGKTLIFGLEGEMGGTVFFAPASYARVAERVRAEYRGPARLDVAVTVNHAYVAGVVNRAPDPPATRARPPSRLEGFQGWGPLLPFAQWPEHERLQKALPDIQRLLASVDVIGVSCYARAGADPKPEELESCAVKADAELAAMGFDLKSWAQRPGKRFIFNEVGLGGGISRCGDAPARSRFEAGLHPNLDVGYPWSRERDPWSRPDLRAYRRQWHRALLELLRRGGSAYPVRGAYLWSLCSIDVQGIHPATTSGGGTWADPEIAADVRAHNLAAAGGGGATSAAAAGDAAADAGAAPAAAGGRRS